MKLTAKSVTLASAFAGAVTFAAAAPAFADDMSGLEKCYGISKAGQNSCATAAATHSCAGQARKDYDGMEWRAVKKGMCTEMGGKTEAFAGVGTPKQMNK
jgi:uncharacterized membrane protein